jgi:hypothetical protein
MPIFINGIDQTPQESIAVIEGEAQIDLNRLVVEGTGSGENVLSVLGSSAGTFLLGDRGAAADLKDVRLSVTNQILEITQLNDNGTQKQTALSVSAAGVVDFPVVPTLSGGAISFPATQVASAGANTLDDYEEGTWTPALADDSLDGSGETQVYGIQVGTYVKVGQLVTIQGRLSTTSIGSLTTTQQARIVGLPFVARTLTNNFGSLTVTSGSGWANSNASTVTGTIGSAAQFAPLVALDGVDGASAFLISEWSADGGALFYGHYQAA